MADLNLSSLNGTNGFVINGIAVDDISGFSVSGAGDINGDGIADIIIGSPSADPNGIGSGQSYVLFGSRSGFSSSFNLSNLNGSNGFRINGLDAGDNSGSSVSDAGDINGDGIADIIIGAPNADPNGDFSGQGYVIYGSRAGFSSSFNLSNLNGSNGFRINGLVARDGLGASVSNAGDVNGDGIGDFILTSPGAFNISGQSHVIYGNRSGFGSSFNLSSLDGSNGFTVDGFSGVVSNAGDFNGDGIADIIIGDPARSVNGTSSGRVTVIFGKGSRFVPDLNINGISSFNLLGLSVSSAGDVNGDRIDDIIIGSIGSFTNPIEPI